ncbi:hypothetical protein FRC05_004705 [Tulasnella sp. 425]|nr:hypothetical protein FRC05_004705 [Tulasnella sp. 425]
MDRHQDVTALLANRLKPLVRVAPRDSFASDSYSLDDHSPVPLKYAEDNDRRSTSHRHHHPFSNQTHFASEDEDSYIEDADDSQDTQSRMSVMGPKIHKNGNAPWEEMDGFAEEPEDYDRPSTPATSIFGKRPKHSRKGSASTTSGLRQRSKTVVEALSPVGALKGLGFAVGASAPASGRSSRNNSVAPSLSKPRPSFQSQSSSSAAGGHYDDDKRSVNTVVDGYNHYPSARQRSRSRPRQETTYADGTIPIDLTGRDSTSFSTSSSSFSDDESSRPPPLPQTSKNPLRIATDVHNSHHSHTDSIVRPEDVFRTSIASINSEYGQRLHPYSNIDARTASTSPTSPVAASAFSSDWANSPSPLEPSRSPAGTLDDSQSSDNNWLDSPSGYGRSAAAGHHFDRSRNGATPLSSKANNRSTASSSSSSSRKKPPPLSLHPSTSSTSISTLAKGGSGGLIPPPPLPTTPVSPSTASGITRSPTPNSEALYRSEDIPATKPLHISRKPVPQQENDSSEYHQGASFATRSNNHPSTMASSTTESSLPFPSTPQQHHQTGDVPPGMLVFPGSPAYGLISLEQAQAKVRGSGPAGRSLSGDVKGKKEGLGGFVARMRLGSEDKAAASLGGSSESPVSPLCGSGSAQENSTKTPGSSGSAQTGTATTNARQPVLRQRKSGFLKIFGGGGDKTSVAPPMPTSPVPRSAGTMISSPMIVGVTDDGLPSPFAPGDAGNRKPMALRDIVGRQGSVSSPSPQVSGRQSNSSSSPPQSFQGRPSVASQGRPSATPSSMSRLKETGLTVFGEEESRSRERSGTTSTVHSPYSEVGPKDESIRSDLSTMGGAEDDAAAEERRMMLKLRPVSGTNFLSTLPSGYLSQPYPGPASTSSSTSSSTLNNSIPFSSTSSEYQFSTSSRSASRPSVSTSSDGKSTPATPSFNSLLSSSSSNWVSSSAYASSESSSSIAPSPLPVTPHSGGTGTMAHQQQMSMMSLVSPTPTQSSFLSSPGRTPQPQFVDVRSAGGSGDGGGMMSMSNVITNLQEELAATRKQMRQQALEMERMKDELEALRKEKEETKTMVCRGCGERDGAPRGASSDSASDASEKRLTGVVNRPRAPTGSGGRFGARMI